MPALDTLLDARYRLQRRIGEGGFAIVYAAVVEGSGSEVAIKVLKPDANGGYDPGVLARFRREANLLATLSCPSTLRLLDHGTDTLGRPFMVFELLGGVDLANYVKSASRLDPREAESVIRQLASSLREAHDRGLLHRDLKPSNVQVLGADDGTLAVKLLDFGLLRFWDDKHPSITKTGELIGTPRYMSPEQLRDSPLSPSSDIYSLGLLFIEVLGGSRLLPSNQWNEQLDRLLPGYAFQISSLPHVEARHAAVIQRMTEVDPRDRYQTVAELLTALDRGSAPLGATATTLRAETRPKRRTTKSTRGVVLVGLLLAVVIAIQLYRASPNQQESRARARPPNSQLSPAINNRTAEFVGEAVDARRFELETELDSCSFPLRAGYGPESEFGTFVYVSDQHEREHRPPLLVLISEVHRKPVSFFEESGFREIADRNGLVVIAPVGADPEGNRPAAHTPRFFDERVLSAIQEYCIDKSRVYLVMQGSGGRIGAQLHQYDWITALATHGARILPAASVPTITMEGNADKWLLRHDGQRVCGTGSSSSLKQLVDHYTQNHACDAAPTGWSHHRNCVLRECNTPWVMCAFPKGGHAWPGTKPRTGKSLNGFIFSYCDAPSSPARRAPAAELAWSFFVHVSSM